MLCNRGANGIDGIVSSAFGAAADGDGPVVLLIGDVALAHDIGGLLAAKRLDLKLTIVLVDNGGGGIFDFLPVSRTAMAQEYDIYTRHIATPTGLDFAQAAGLYGLAHERVETVPASALPWSGRSRRRSARRSCRCRPTARATSSCIGVSGPASRASWTALAAGCVASDRTAKRAAPPPPRAWPRGS